MNHDLEWHVERGLNSLELLSHLKVASHITGDPKYAAVARELIEKHAYATNTIDQKLLWPPHAVNHSDDELAFLSYYPLLRYERDTKLARCTWPASAARGRSSGPRRARFSTTSTRPPSSSTPGPTRASGRTRAMFPRRTTTPTPALAWFREVPSDTIYWSVQNSHRRDLGPRAATVSARRCSRRRSTSRNGS
ncbi:MAG: hypothetical protein U0836_07145 [Pirellulales bacterium]